MNKRMEIAEAVDKFEMVTVFRNGNLLNTTLSAISFVYDQGRRNFKHFVINDDHKNLLDMVRSLQMELRKALQASRHILRPGETKFELLARDPQAPWHVRHWAHRRALAEPQDPKIVAALRIADSMEKWKKENPQVGMPAHLGAETPETIRQAAEELVRLAQNHGMTLSISVSQADGGVQTQIDIGKFNAPAL